MQLLFTSCNTLDVTRPHTHKKKKNRDSVWVSLAALGSGQLQFNNVSLTMATCFIHESTFASTNIWKLRTQTGVTCSGVLLQLCSGHSILLISSTIWCRFWQISTPLLSESNQRKNTEKRNLLICCIPVRLRPSVCGRLTVQGTRQSKYATQTVIM